MPERVGQAAWLGGHALTMSPCTPKLSHQTASPHAPNLTWKLAVQSTHVTWCFFLLLLSPGQPLGPRLACTLVLPGRLVVPRGMDIAPTALWQGKGITSSQRGTRLTFSTNLVLQLICPAHLTWRRWDGAQDSGAITLFPCHHPRHPASFPQEQPALANKASCSRSRATLMGIYSSNRDINNLINTENTQSV